MPLTAYLQLTASQLSNIQFYEFVTRDMKSRARARADPIGPYIGDSYDKKDERKNFLLNYIVSANTR